MKNGLGTPQSVILFGGTSDIGLAIVRQLLQQGTLCVGLCGRSGSRLSSEVQKLNAENPRARIRYFDFEAKNIEEIQDLVDSVVTWAGDIDVVLLSHGFLPDEHLGFVGLEFGMEAIFVNMTSQIAIALVISKVFKAQSHGCIVLISSVAGVRVRRSLPVYGASKAGSDAFFVALDHYLSEFGAQSVVLRPGFVSTKMTHTHTPAPFATSPDAVAKDLVRGLRNNKRIIWSPQILRPIFWIIKLLPEKLWRRLNEATLEKHWHP